MKVYVLTYDSDYYLHRYLAVYSTFEGAYAAAIIAANVYKRNDDVLFKHTDCVELVGNYAKDVWKVKEVGLLD